MKQFTMAGRTKTESCVQQPEFVTLKVTRKKNRARLLYKYLVKKIFCV